MSHHSFITICPTITSSLFVIKFCFVYSPVGWEKGWSSDIISKIEPGYTACFRQIYVVLKVVTFDSRELKEMFCKILVNINPII